MARQRLRDPRSRVALGGLLLLASIATAHAQARPSAQLRYRHPPELADCPDELELRNAIAGRLGYDPFEPTAPRLVLATIARDATGLHADIEIRGDDNTVLGTRRLSAARNDCRELGSAMELAISVAIDPLSLSRPPLPPAPPPPPPAAPEPIAPQPQPPPPPPTAAVAVETRVARPLSLRASASLLSSLGAGPAIDAGFAVQIGLRSGMVSLGLEGRGDLPASATELPTGGGVQSSLLLAALVPCIHYRVARGCAVAGAGELYGSGIHVDQPHDQHTFYAAAGARAGIELHLAGRLSLDVHVDLLGTLTRTTLRLANMDVWTTPPVSAALGVGVVGNFL